MSTATKRVAISLTVAERDELQQLAHDAGEPIATVAGRLVRAGLADHGAQLDTPPARRAGPPRSSRTPAASAHTNATRPPVRSSTTHAAGGGSSPATPFHASTCLTACLEENSRSIPPPIALAGSSSIGRAWINDHTKTGHSTAKNINTASATRAPIAPSRITGSKSGSLWLLADIRVFSFGSGRRVAAVLRSREIRSRHRQKPCPLFTKSGGLCEHDDSLRDRLTSG